MLKHFVRYKIIDTNTSIYYRSYTYEFYRKNYDE